MTQVLQREVFEYEKVPTAVNNIKVKNGDAQSAYRLNGVKANEDDRGVIIQNGIKYVRK
jgi:hypothetical protein